MMGRGMGVLVPASRWNRLAAALLVECSIGGCLVIGSPGQSSLTSDCLPVAVHASAQFGGDWSGDGQRVVCLSTFDVKGRIDPGVYVADVASGNARQVLASSGLFGPVRCRWNPKLDLVLLDFGTTQGILDLESSAVSFLADEGRALYRGTWSPEGDSVWYVRDASNSEPPSASGLYVMSRLGGASRPFRPADGTVITPNDWLAFSPDGGEIAYAAEVFDSNGQDTGGSEIDVIQRDGTRRRQVTRLGGISRNPQWIENGRAILFDYVSAECALTGGATVERRLLVLNLGTGAIENAPHVLATAAFQFSFPPVLDRSAERVLTIAGGEAPYASPRVGFFYVGSWRKGDRRALFGHPKLGG